MRASSCSHEKNNCVPREGAGESTWSDTRASVTQKQSWLSSTRSQLPANTVINETAMKANESFNAVTCKKPSGLILRRHPARDYFSQSQEVLEISQALECLTKNDYLGVLVSFKDQMERLRLRLQKCRCGRRSGRRCITAAAVLL